MRTSSLFTANVAINTNKRRRLYTFVSVVTVTNDRAHRRALLLAGEINIGAFAPLRMYWNVMSMWSLKWHFANKSVTRAPYSITVCGTDGHYGEEYDDWNIQCRLEVAEELQPRWRGTNRRRKSIPAAAVASVNLVIRCTLGLSNKRPQ